MIKTLEELVFGLNSYEKVKIEDRYEKIYSILKENHSLQISNIENFNVLEQCLFKIQDQLRLKSSNLNAIIKKPNSLTKKKIEAIIKLLNLKREEVINLAFVHTNNQTNINSKEYSPIVSEIEDDNSMHENVIKKELRNSANKNVISQDENTIEEKKLKDSYQSQSLSPNQLNKESKKQYQQDLISENGKVRVNINFEEGEINLITAKDILEKLYSTHLYNSTLLYAQSCIKRNKSPICLGITSQDVLNNPLIKRTPYIEDNLQGTYEAIVQKKFKLPKETNTLSEKNNTSQLQTHKELTKSKDTSYITIDNEVKDIDTQKFEEDSLEKLVLSQEDSEKYVRGIDHDENEQAITVNKSDESVIVEKKKPSEDEDKNNNHKIKTEDEIKPYTYESFEEESLKVPSKIKTKHDSDLEKDGSYEKEIPENTNEIQNVPKNKEDTNYEVYSDENISLELNQKGLVQSQFKILFKSKNQLINEKINSLIHVTLFSKHFLTTIFETSKADATMMVTSLFSNSIDLIPRFQNDNIFSLGGKNASEEELTYTQELIHKRLVQELHSQEPGQQTPNSKNQSDANSKANHEESSNNNNNSSKKRARYLLSSLRRLG